MIDSPTSEAEFQNELSTLIRRAARNGVDVGNGGYEIKASNEDGCQWDVIIICVE
jgi:hypothetical protein